MKSLLSLRRAPLLAALVALAAVVAAGAVSYAATGPAIQTSTPRSEKQIVNLDVLRQQIRNYYGDPLGTGVFAPDSSYAREAEHVAADGADWLAGRGRGRYHGHVRRSDHGHVREHGHTRGRDQGPVQTPGRSDGTPAIVLDVDDTTLATWNYEVFSNWAYNPTTNGEYVDGQRFPAVPGMVEMVNEAAEEGYAIFFLTGRPAAQEAATLGNLTVDHAGEVDAGYPAPTQLSDGEDGLFTKPAVADYPQYLKDACAADANGSCTTVHYKSATRAHIESLGYDIVANFGDQFSDLEGGYADRTFKLPNPNYFLP